MKKTKAIATPGDPGACPIRNFFFQVSVRCLLVFSKGTFQALKKLIFQYFFLEFRMDCFYARGGRRHEDRSETLLLYWMYLYNSSCYTAHNFQRED